MNPRVYVSRIIPEPGNAIVRENSDATFHLVEEPPTREELLEKTRESVGVLVLLTERIDREFLENAKRLKVVSSFSVGVDHIDVETATEKGVMVTNTPDVLTEATADFTFALILSASRRAAEADRYVRNGMWKMQWSPNLLLGYDVHGATLGTVGFGRIGQAVAKRASGFGMNVIYFDRHNSNKDAAMALNAKYVQLNELFEQSDIVTVHLPLTEETRHLIGRQEFGLMKKTAVFVNASRGGIVDQKALFDALSRNQIFAAGLDVFDDEPIKPNDPLLKLENIVLAPHIGSASVQSRAKMSELAATNLIEALSGKVPRSLVNKEVLSKVRAES